MRVFVAKIEGGAVFINPPKIEEYAKKGYTIEEEGVGVVFAPGEAIPHEFIKGAIEGTSQTNKKREG
jgi:hypothetical protein